MNRTDQLLTPQQAFAAATMFLKRVFVKVFPFDKLGEFGLFIEDAETYDDYVCTDMAYWEDWRKLVGTLLNISMEEVTRQQSEPLLTPTQSFQVMTKLVSHYMEAFEFSDHGIYFSELKISTDTGLTTRADMWSLWLEIADEAIAGKVNSD